MTLFCLQYVVDVSSTSPSAVHQDGKFFVITPTNEAKLLITIPSSIYNFRGMSNCLSRTTGSMERAVLARGRLCVFNCLFVRTLLLSVYV